MKYFENMKKIEIKKGDLVFLEEGRTFLVKKGKIKIIYHGEKYLNPKIASILS